MTDTTADKAYLLLGCPFCFKFLLFMTEAGLRDQIEVIALDHSAPDYGDTKQALEEKAGRKVSFPTVEIAPGVYESDTQALIDHYRAKGGIGDASLPTLAFYEQGLFQNVVNLFKENMALKKELGKS